MIFFQEKKNISKREMNQTTSSGKNENSEIYFLITKTKTLINKKEKAFLIYIVFFVNLKHTADL